jgi:hypothetical protein
MLRGHYFQLVTTGRTCSRYSTLCPILLEPQTYNPTRPRSTWPEVLVGCVEKSSWTMPKKPLGARRSTPNDVKKKICVSNRSLVLFFFWFFDDPILFSSFQNKTQDTKQTKTHDVNCHRKSLRRGHVSVLMLNKCGLRCPTGPFPVSPVPVLAGEAAHRYRL